MTVGGMVDPRRNRSRSLLACAVMLAGCAAPSTDGDGATVLVTQVVDGDTIRVQLRDREVRVRLIGIDTPEVAPGQPMECFGEEASTFTERELDGERVRLEFDVERFDRFGRTLAYVFHDGLFNEELVAQGYATVTTFPPNVRYVGRFLAAQRAAREAGRGLWGACGGS